MNLKKNLEEDPIFCGNAKIGMMLISLHKKGIYTIEDFINCSVLDLHSPRARAFARILRYKYLNEPLVMAPLLDKEFSKEMFNPETQTIKHEILEIFQNLGFMRYHTFNLYKAVVDRARVCGSIKIIDIIDNIDEELGYAGLKDFYINYYNDKKDKESQTEEKKKLIELKDEIVFAKLQIDNLIKMRDELDAKIVELQNQKDSLIKIVEK